MNDHISYRYHDFKNQSFQNEFRSGNANNTDFTGSRLRSCDFRGTNLTGADFSETSIGRDAEAFQAQIRQMVLHIILGVPLGLAAWFSGRLVFIGCGGEVSNPYGWLTNPFVWMFAFATAATMSKRRLFYVYIGLISLLLLTPLIGHPAVIVVSVGLMVMAFATSIFGMYLGYRKGSIAVGMVWMAVAVSSAVSAGYSWIKLHEHYYAILFAILTIVPAILATKAFNLHFAKVKMSAMTSFYGADLENARFVNAVLENCDFRNANLKGIDWNGATFENCKFPKDFSRDQQRAIARIPEIAQSIAKLTVNN